MKKLFLLRAVSIVGLGLVVGCSSTPKQDQLSKPDSGAQETEITDDTHFLDGTLIAPGTEFARYKKILIVDLDVNDIEMKQPAAEAAVNPWKLSQEDKNVFRSLYTAAVVNSLIADGAYSTALSPAEDVFILRSKILQIVPLRQPATSKQAEAMNMYNNDAVAVTLVMELYDTETNKLIGAFTNTRDVGRLWDKNNKSQTYKLLLTAFDNWLGFLRTELDTLSRRQTPLEKLLR